ncbi:hypothetical protein [Sedimentitalea arenosa]|uniref:Uncharacterized protein n=1 Tax=Sedimentitalea arenosa TaxID=2798803 RepID=A0A8J7IS79_9RHOB|nr:hypothetical protein [Arenibacterium arenosum]MBJ6370347.1 hypothetical protein [Arenibacterium arenosum]
MTATTFQDRIARIEQRRPAQPQFTPKRFAPPPERAARLQRRRRPGARRNLVSLATGALSGILAGVLVQGAVLTGAPWGPGTPYNELVGLVGVAGLLAALPMLLLSVYLRARRPGLFFFSAAYALMAISVALA